MGLLANHAGLNGLLQALREMVASPHVELAVHLFADLALATSFLGVALGLFDYLADLFQRSNTVGGRLQTGAITFLPPLAFALFYPRGFVMALGVEFYSNALDEERKLRISLELYLKRLIVGGLERVYEIGRVFRNEGVDTRHNPEFTLMELYQAYTDYEGMMELTESMFRYLAEKVCGTTLIKYGDNEIDLGKPFERLTMNDAIKKYAGIDFDAVKTDEEAKALAKEHHIEFEDRHTKGDIINLFFEEYCEKNLIQPTFIMDHPLAISPLTKKKPTDPEKVERFELFINTWEMCNAYSELNDPIDQRERFAAQDANAAAGDEEAEHTDEDFLNALEIGMAPTGGIGYGIDRLCMLLTDSETIRDVLLFPTLKSVKK